MQQILALSHVRKSYDGQVVLDDVTLAFRPGAKIGVVGPNGTGKSTLLRMMAGLEPPSNGEVHLVPGYRVGLLPQEPVLDEHETVLGNVAESITATRALLARYQEVTGKLAADYSDELLAELGRLDPGTRPGPRLPVRGELLDLPGNQGRPDDGPGPAGRQAAQAAAG
jgi:ATPase subunit of ABC transporter with duplicated ATPase domains